MGKFVAFVCIETQEKMEANGIYYFQVKHLLEKTSGLPCLLLDWRWVRPGFLEELGVRAAVLSGTGTDFLDIAPPERWEEFRRFVQGTEISLLGICGGHQLLAALLGPKPLSETLQIPPMRKLRPGEPDLEPSYHPGFFKEKGMFWVEVVRDDPIFRGLEKGLYVAESHYCEVKELPKELKLLASTPDCRVQAFRHRTRPIYGCQFHPESTELRYGGHYPDGRKFLENFFRVVGIWK